MNEKDLRDIIAQVLSEMNVTDTTSATSAAPAQKADTASAATEDGFFEDVAEVDIKKQYLVEHPVAGDAYYELKQYAPCRLGIGKAGARYKTLPVLEFRAAHSAAQDAVFTDVDPEVIEKLGLFTVQTKCDSKDTYLTRPDLGRVLSDEAVQTIKEKCKMHPTVQIYVSDGLSSAAVAANTADVLPAILQGLKSYGIEAGTPFFVKYGRVGVMDQISEITGADVTCVLIGERPGLITAESILHILLTRQQLVCRKQEEQLFPIFTKMVRSRLRQERILQISSRRFWKQKQVEQTLNFNHSGWR